MTELTDNTAANRFEMAMDGAVAFVEYERRPEAVVLIHTEVPEALGGRGVGSRLAKAVLNRVGAEGRKVVPRCEFIAAYVERHPEFRTLVAG